MVSSGTSTRRSTIATSTMPFGPPFFHSRFLHHPASSAASKSTQTDAQVPEGTPVFTPGTELAEEFAELKPTGNEAVVKKIHPGSFAETNLDSLLQKGGIKRLVLVGYMSHVCVSTTARQAAQRGYDVLVVEDAIGDRDVPGASAEQLVQVRIASVFCGVHRHCRGAEQRCAKFGDKC